jgi:XTP/dITP diphosphohydrolase
MEKMLVLASDNKGKLREFQAMFSPLGIKVTPQGAYCVPTSPEPYGTFLENALAKARNAARATGLPAMADDSGICVRALGGMPGVHSARFAGEPKDDDANNRLLVEKLRDKSDRSAHYVCVLAAVRTPNDPEPLIAVGRWFGEVCEKAAGEGGFGYDPHFYVPELGKTAAELSAEEKNRLSHRGLALEAMIPQLRSVWGW